MTDIVFEFTLDMHIEKAPDSNINILHAYIQFWYQLALSQTSMPLK